MISKEDRIVGTKKVIKVIYFDEGSATDFLYVIISRNLD